jgi:hypothetical protein
MAREEAGRPSDIAELIIFQKCSTRCAKCCNTWNENRTIGNDAGLRLW